ncbi:MAG: hypothetical protein Q9163_001497 [Psora crenata]
MTPRRPHSHSLSYQFGTEKPITINLDSSDEYESDGTLKEEEFEERFISPTSTPKPDASCHREPDPETDAIFRVLPTLSLSSFTLRPGKTVELKDGEFLRVTLIVEARDTKDTVIRGLRFRRNSDLEGLLEKKRNEVTLILNYSVFDSRDIIRQSTQSVRPDEVVKVRELVKTNQPFPALNYDIIDPRSTQMGRSWIYANCRLALTHEECDNGQGVESEALRLAFRGSTNKGGSCIEWDSGENYYDQQERIRCNYKDPLGFYQVVENNNLTANYWRGPRYTLGDGFCGAGGTSRGAKAAGLRVEWGFDFDPAAIESFSLNFSGARCWAIAVHEFVMVIKEDFKVDILHLSPPCQPFSPIHARPGKDDEMNTATFFAIEDLIKKIKPRIITLEETFGLTRTLDNIVWFKAMVHMFTRQGFSVRWKVFNLCDFGLPQPRKRLFIFASCPGETLPDFPEPTHCKPADKNLFPDRRPYLTVNQAIAGIPNHISHFNPDHVPKLNSPAFDGDLPLRSTITCTSGAHYHPSGKRNFTLREIACLQGFPLEHEFGRTRVRKQIGNAVPPIVAKAFFEQIISALRKADGY